MRVVATSDFHGTLPEIPECDLLLIGGDVCPVWDHNRKFQADWLRGEFNEWLRQVPAQEIVGIAGNHDFVLQDSKKLGYELDWIYLNNESVTVSIHNGTTFESLNIWGSPYSNKFGGWAFMTSEVELSRIYHDIPRDVDIIISHGPPWGFGDEVVGFSMTKRGMIEAAHVGSTSLANQLFYEVWENLKLVTFGHIHEGYGKYEMKNIRMLNTSLMNDEYKPVNPPIELEL